MPVTIKPQYAENLTFIVRTLEGGVGGISYFEMLGGKLRAKNIWVHITSRNKIYDYESAKIQNAIEATVYVSTYSNSRPSAKTLTYMWTALMACIAGLGLLSLFLKG